MNAKTRKNRTHQQARSRRQKRVSGESFGNDELTTGNYEKKILPNSRARDLKSETTSATHGRGPRGARGQMREEIKQVAESQFITHGYDGTTMRSIAKGAGCDPAMVSYYFGSKQRLFRDCFDLPLDPLEQILQLWEPGIEGIADRLLDFAFTLYEERLTKDRMKALMRALITDSETTQRFRAYMSDNLLKGGAEVLNALQIASGKTVNEKLETNFQVLIEIIMSMIYGVATMRYIIQLEPVASMPRSELQNRLAPILQTQIENLAHEVFPSLVPDPQPSEDTTPTAS
ncbi:TetR/AcrR family transcriptional regulator [Varibaculum cambriense]|uniref:TetR/AcrR family transcriptional regulator n=1 Tax=Varibaculum cambriense TaxID=184870 RepID=UPI00290102DC|nr:TetR family transcriptional regulator [Varibaculum cambriense]MDU1224354.1 TetR family transcriptional regulator [Varibaculum cambriense]